MSIACLSDITPDRLQNLLHLCGKARGVKVSGKVPTDAEKEEAQARLMSELGLPEIPADEFICELVLKLLAVLGKRNRGSTT